MDMDGVALKLLITALVKGRKVGDVKGAVKRTRTCKFVFAVWRALRSRGVFVDFSTEFVWKNRRLWRRRSMLNTDFSFGFEGAHACSLEFSSLGSAITCPLSKLVRQSRTAPVSSMEWLPAGHSFGLFSHVCGSNTNSTTQRISQDRLRLQRRLVHLF